MIFDGQNWVPLGQEGFTNDIAKCTNLAIGSNDQPFVTFNDNSAAGGASVMKFDGTGWTYVGQPGLSANYSVYTNIQFGSAGELYCSFQDGGNYNKVTVMKFEEPDWIPVGQPGFSPGYSYKPSLAISPSGQPHVGFIDVDNGWKATVMKYDSVYVGMNEPQHPQLTIYPNPASTALTIDFKNATCKINLVEITDIRGNKMFEIKTAESRFTVQVKNYPAGIYFVILNSDGLKYFRKFCKN